MAQEEGSHFNLWYSRYPRVLSHFSSCYFYVGTRESRVLTMVISTFVTSRAYTQSFPFLVLQVLASSQSCHFWYSRYSRVLSQFGFWYSRDRAIQNDWYSRVIDGAPMTCTGTLDGLSGTALQLPIMIPLTLFIGKSHVNGWFGCSYQKRGGCTPASL